jgi:hypothetical protein
MVDEYGRRTNCTNQIQVGSNEKRRRSKEKDWRKATLTTGKM